MSRRPAVVTQVKRIVKAVIAAGLAKDTEEIVEVTVTPEGGVSIQLGSRSAEHRANLSQNEWDEVLK
jgi:hypothetical protein